MGLAQAVVADDQVARAPSLGVVMRVASGQGTVEICIDPVSANPLCQTTNLGTL
jgi:hypothetical protein